MRKPIKHSQAALRVVRKTQLRRNRAMRMLRDRAYQMFLESKLRPGERWGPWTWIPPFMYLTPVQQG